MSKKQRVIDFLDLTLILPDQIRSIIEDAVREFVEHYDHIEREPRIKGNKLLVNSTDLVALFGYIDPQRLSEFDRRLLVKLCSEEIDQRLLRSVSIDHQQHYKWCLAAFKSFKIGRFL